MRIRSLATAALTVLLGTTACGSEARDTTWLASADNPTTSTSSTTTPTSSTATDAPTADRVPTSSATSAPSAASSPEAPAAGQLTPNTMPAQTLTTLPSDSFTVTYQGTTYYCEPHSYSDKQNDCVRYYGGSAPLVIRPELYCSYSARPECSKQWYPADLEDADMVTMGGQTYVCRTPILEGELWDKECAPYSGGDPDRVSFYGALKCTPDLGTLRCDDEYFPSEMEGLTEVRIGYSNYLCTTGYGSKKCWKWSSYESPKTATMGTPDLYCNSSGTCAEDGYPNGY
jgi:hypothetical protein